MLNVWLVPLVLLCSINPEGDPGGGALHRAVIDDAARWGHGALITGKRQRTDASDAPLHVALTFDDGPSAKVTPIILDTLDEYEVTATFFAVGWRFEGGGKRARAQAAVLREVAARGYAIGNHTVNHHDLRYMSAREARRQIDRNEELMTRELGRRPYLFRPPFGGMTPAVRRHLAERGYTTVRWNIESSDYMPRAAATMPTRIVEDLIEKGGGVVLMHDTKPWTARALPELLAALETENCRRRRAGERLLVPVTLDFFMRDADGTPRDLPADAIASETRYLERLKRVCATD